MSGTTFAVGDHIRVTRIRPVGPDDIHEGVIAEIEPEGFADSGKPYPPYAVIEDENGKYVTSFPMAYDGKSIEFTETYRVEILEPAPMPSPVDDKTPSLTGTPVKPGQIWAWKDEDFANGDPGHMFRTDSESDTPGHWKYGYVGDSVRIYGEGPKYVASAEVITRAASLVQDAPTEAPQDHGPLAAVLSDRTLAKVRSRPAYVPRDTPSLVELDREEAWLEYARHVGISDEAAKVPNLSARLAFMAGWNAAVQS